MGHIVSVADTETEKTIAMQNFFCIIMAMTPRKYIIPAVLLLFPCMALQAHAQDASKKTSPKKGTANVVNRIAASVNGRPITSASVRMRLAPIIHELLALYPRQGPKFLSELVKAKNEILDDLIETEMVLGEFEGKGYSIPDEHIESAINNRILVQYNGNRDLFLKGLKQAGMSLSEFREMVKREETVSAMRASRYERGVPPTPDEIAAEYEAVKSDFRDMTQDRVQFDKIYIPANPDDVTKTPDDQLNLAESLAKDIRAGKISFADAAKQYSKDAMAEQGGRWEETKRGDLAPEFAAIIFSSEPRKVIGPVFDGRYGFTIVRVIKKHLAPAPPLSKIKQQVDASVRRKRSEARYRQWIERLRKKAIIRKFI